MVFFLKMWPFIIKNLKILHISTDFSIQSQLYIFSVFVTVASHFYVQNLYYIPMASIRKDYKLNGLKPNNLFSQLCRLEVQNQKVGKIGSFWRVWGRIHFRPLPYLLIFSGNPWLMVHHSHHSLHHLQLFLCKYLSVPLHDFLLRNINHWTLGPP